MDRNGNIEEKTNKLCSYHYKYKEVECKCRKLW